MNEETQTRDLDLRDIHLPNGVDWLPLAPGWWWLLGVACAVLFAVLLVRAYRRRRSPVAHVQARLDAILLACRDDSARCAEELTLLLRRTSLMLHGGDAYTNSSDGGWFAWLSAQAGDTACESRLVNAVAGERFAAANGSADALIEHAKIIIARLPRRVDAWRTS